MILVYDIIITRTAGLLIQKVDVDAKIGDKTLAIEYEVPGSHNFNELVEKRQRAESKYDEVVFICPQANFNDVVKACGLENTIQRGLQLEENLMKVVEDLNPYDITISEM